MFIQRQNNKQIEIKNLNRMPKYIIECGKKKHFVAYIPQKKSREEVAGVKSSNILKILS